MEISNTPAFGPFIEKCREHGFAKTTAYELLNEGLLESFTIGTRRYVVLQSLRDLPAKLAERAAKAAA